MTRFGFWSFCFLLSGLVVHCYGAADSRSENPTSFCLFAVFAIDMSHMVQHMEPEYER